jgi:tRNA wybutosine-synthesizing protein 2
MELQDKAKEKDGEWKKIRHVNLGLLPSSKGAWEGAVQVLDWEMGGWIHVHENVNGEDIGGWEGVVVGMLRMMVWRRDDAMGKGKQGWIREMERRGRSDGVRCVHVEKVKSYAPGVWHVVYDVFVPPWEGEGGGI